MNPGKPFKCLESGCSSACFPGQVLALNATGVIAVTWVHKPPASTWSIYLSTCPELPWDVSRLARRRSVNLHFEPLKWGATCYKVFIINSSAIQYELFMDYSCVRCCLTTNKHKPVSPILVTTQQAHTHVSIVDEHPTSTHPCFHC